MLEKDPAQFKVVKAILDNGEMRFTIQGPNVRNYPDQIKNRDKIYYYTGKPKTLDESIDELRWILDNKVLRQERHRYINYAIKRISISRCPRK